jgi:hypothetical protein
MNAIDRFKSKILIQPSGCWHYQGARDGDGYGMFWFQNRTIGAHRFSAEHLGGLIIQGACVCHRCDNTICVNPNHLFIGSNKLNTLDRHSKGRSAVGSRVGTSKLSEQQIKEIRYRYQQSNGRRGILTELAYDYGVTVTPIWLIVNRKSWQHI